MEQTEEGADAALAIKSETVCQLLRFVALFFQRWPMLSAVEKSESEPFSLRPGSGIPGFGSLPYR